MVHADDSPGKAALAARHHLRFLGEGGPTLLFCHGFGTDQSLWRLVAEPFLGSHRLVLLDHVGSGRSDPDAYRPEKYATLGGYVQDLLEVCRSFDLREVSLVGHSVGAMIGLLAALEAPERFTGLVMIGASPRYLNDGGYVGGFTAADLEELLVAFDLNREAWCEQMAVAAMANPDRPELAAELTSLFRSAKPAVLRQFARTTFTADCRPQLPACATPVLLLQSRKDVIVPVPVSEYLQAALPAAQLEWLKAEGHFAHLSAPAEVAGLIQGFLERTGMAHG